VRATLHDELMREAGFESDYHHARERRRAAKRRTALLGLLVVIFLCALAGVVVWLDEWLALPIPRVVIVGLVMAGVVGHFVWLMSGWLTRHAGIEYSRRAMVSAAVRASSLVLIVAAVVQLVAPYLPGIPKSIVIAALVLGLVLEAVAFVKNRVLPWMEDQI
jgi:MFS family permease